MEVISKINGLNKLTKVDPSKDKEIDKVNIYINNYNKLITNRNFFMKYFCFFLIVKLNVALIEKWMES